MDSRQESRGRAAERLERADRRRERADRRLDRVATRKSADERREDVVRAAVDEFAIYGLHGTSTEQIAKRVKISQPYIFRLFPTKKDLFLAAVDSCFDRVEAAFRAAVNDPTQLEHNGADGNSHLKKMSMNPRLHAMGHAYAGLLGAERELLLFQMQAYAACSDEAVRRRVGRRWQQLMHVVSDLSGASDADIKGFFARGMLLNVVVSIGLVPAKSGKSWAHEALGFA